MSKGKKKGKNPRDVLLDTTTKHVEWRSIEKSLISYGCTIDNKRGPSRSIFLEGMEYPISIHVPHPESRNYPYLNKFYRGKIKDYIVAYESTIEKDT